jgi:hypothetical protein
MSDAPESMPRRHQIEVPPELVVGVPADFASVWHTPESFVIDFLSARGPAQIVDDQGGPVLSQDLVVSARVRMPRPTSSTYEGPRAPPPRETQTGQRSPVEPPHLDPRRSQD